MRDREAFARDGFDEAAFQLLTRRKADGMDEDVEAVPVFAQSCAKTASISSSDVTSQGNSRSVF